MAGNTPVMYGIPNCGTIKKARAWLEDHGVDYEFHDYKKKGADQGQLQAWIDEFGWNQIVNTRGMTWRKLDQDIRDNMDETAAIEIMLEKPSIIKRPLLDLGGHVPPAGPLAAVLGVGDGHQPESIGGGPGQQEQDQEVDQARDEVVQLLADADLLQLLLERRTDTFDLHDGI